MVISEKSHGYIEEVMNKTKRAADIFTSFGSDKTYRTSKAVYEVAFNSRFYLAQMAHEEIEIGKISVTVDIIATRFVYHDIKDFLVAEVISSDHLSGTTEITC